MMTEQESVAEAIRLLTETGSKRVEVRGSHPYWLVACDWGTSATSPEDHTFDEPHECAAALVAARAEPAQTPAHETDSEIVPEGNDFEERGAHPAVGLHSQGMGDAEGADGSSAESPVYIEGAEVNSAYAGPSLSVEKFGDGWSFTRRSAPMDAEYGAADLDPGVVRHLTEEAIDPLALPEPDPQDFAPDEIEPVDEVAEAVAIFGDNLPMQRLLLIGAVTRHAAQIKAILQDGWSLDEFRSLQNLVVRIDRGEAPDDPVARARFQAISEASRAMSATDAHAEAQVAFLEGASREQIEAYRVEDGWP